MLQIFKQNVAGQLKRMSQIRKSNLNFSLYPGLGREGLTNP